MAHHEWVGSSSDSFCSTPDGVFSPGSKDPSYQSTPNSHLSDEEDAGMAKMVSRMHIVYREIHWAFEISSTDEGLLTPCLESFQKWLAKFNTLISGPPLVEISSSLMLASYFLEHLLSLRVPEKQLRTLVKRFEQDFLSDLDIHSLALDLDSPSRTFLLRVYYSAIQTANLSLKPAASALARKAEKNDVHIFALFGGQGTSNPDCLRQLSHLFSTYVGLLDELVEVFAQALDTLTRLPRTRDFFEIHGFDIKAWLADPTSAPDQKYIASAPISFPLVGLLGLSHYYITCKILGKTPGEMRKLLGGVTGHSQGIIVAAAISGSDSWASLHAAAELVVAILFWIGFESYHGTSWGDCTPASTVAKSPATTEQLASPMLSVRGLERSTLQLVLDQANKHHSATDQMYLTLVNNHENMVIAGPPRSLMGLNLLFQELGAEDGLNQSRIPFNLRKPIIQVQFLPISAPFHSPHLNDALKRTLEAVAGIPTGQLGIPTYHTRTGEDLREVPERNLTGELVKMVMTECVDWQKACSFPGATHILDFGPGRISSLLKEKTDGSGIRVILASEIHASKHFGGKADIFSPKMHAPVPNWEEIYRPKLRETSGGQIELVTKMTELFQTPPVMVAGMTPTTAHWDFASAVVKAGYHVELAGGGFSDPNQFEEAIRTLSENMRPDRGITCNLIYASPQSMAWQIPLIGDLIRKGVMIDGLTIGAGVPSLAIVEDYVNLGLKHISFKPGTYESILDVIEIAKAHPLFPIGLQWTGGRAGGHHSAEDFHGPIIRAYGLIRECSNIFLVAGSGFGSPDAEDSFPYLTGEWSSSLGYARMPFDGILLGSRMMVAKEAHTSQTVKQLIVDTPGVDDSEWPGTYKNITGGVLTVNSEMGQPIHKLATRGVILWRELDDEIFSIKDPGKRLSSLQKNRTWIMERLNKDFQKPWFGVKDSGEIVDLEGMTYAEVLRRLVSLMYVEDQKRWIHSSYKMLVLDVAIRMQERLPAMYTFRKDLTDQPRKFLLHFIHCFPSAETRLLQLEDARHVLSLFNRRGQKPVNFIPAMDERFEQWFKKDSLWQAEDVDAVFDRDVQRICVIQGPVAASHSKDIDEPIQIILDTIVTSLITRLTHHAWPAGDTGLSRRKIAHSLKSLDGLLSSNQYQVTESMDEKVHIFASQGPLDKDILAIAELMRRMPGWAHACLQDTWISQGGTRQRNPVRSVFTARHGHMLTIKYDLKEKTTCVTLSRPDVSTGKIRELARIASAGDKRVVVTLCADYSRSILGPTIKFVFEFMPGGRDGRLREEMTGRNMRIKDFYAKLWSGGPSMRARISDLFYGAPVTLCRSLITEFMRVLGDSNFDSRSLAKGVPMDVGIFVAWEALVHPLLIPDIDGDLLQLLHQSNEFQYLPDVEVFQVGDVLDSTSRVNSIVSQIDRKTIEVIATIRRKDEPIMKVTSVFVIRGKFSAYADSFRYMEDEISLSVTSTKIDAVLRSRSWIQLNDKGMELRGRTLVFKVKSRLDYNSVGLSYRLQVSGTIKSQAGDSLLQQIGKLQFDSLKCSGNPVTEFLKHHGTPSHPLHPLNNPQLGSNVATTIKMPLSNAPYARVSKDTNPIHTSHVFASWLQLPGPITHGMYTSAAVRRAVENSVAEADTTRFRRYSAHFQGMVLPRDELRVEWRHVAMVEGRMQVTIQAYNTRTDEKVLDAEGEVEQPCSTYIFTGQGSQEKGMGMELYQNSAAARDIWDRGDSYLMTQYGFSIIDVVQRDPKKLEVHLGGLRGRKVRDNFLAMTTDISQADGRIINKCIIDGLTFDSVSHTFQDVRGLLYSTQFAQPALVLMQLAVFEDLKSKGLIKQKSVFAGHSLGEYAALGALTNFMPLESLLDLVFYRGLAMQTSMDRDDQGQTQYSMVAVSPSRLGNGFRLESFEKIISIISQKTALLLEIVNFNIEGQQYVCAGHLHALWMMTEIFNRISKSSDITLNEPEHIIELVRKCLPAMKELPRMVTLERGFATIPLSGIDIPFHSKLLRGGIDSYRKFLRKKIFKNDIDPEKLVGKFIPNLTGSIFSIDRAYVERVIKLTGSSELKDLISEVRVFFPGTIPRS